MVKSQNDSWLGCRILKKIRFSQIIYFQCYFQNQIGMGVHPGICLGFLTGYYLMAYPEIFPLPGLLSEYQEFLLRFHQKIFSAFFQDFYQVCYRNSAAFLKLDLERNPLFLTKNFEKSQKTSAGKIQRRHDGRNLARNYKSEPRRNFCRYHGRSSGTI